MSEREIMNAVFEALGLTQDALTQIQGDIRRAKENGLVPEKILVPTPEIRLFGCPVHFSPLFDSPHVSTKKRQNVFELQAAAIVDDGGERQCPHCQDSLERGAVCPCERDSDSEADL